MCSDVMTSSPLPRCRWHRRPPTLYSYGLRQGSGRSHQAPSRHQLPESIDVDEHLPAPAMDAASVSVPRIKLGSQGLEVSAQGLGCMGMSAFYGPPKPEPDMIKLIHHAVASGVTLLDTSDMYGPHTNEILLGKVGPLELLDPCCCRFLWPFFFFSFRTEDVRCNASEF